MIKALKRLGFALLGLGALSACKFDVLAPSGHVAASQRDLLVISTGLMLLIIIPVMVLTVYFAWKYRAGNKNAEYSPDWDHSTKLELVIWAAPLLIIICLGALTWVGTHLLDPYRPLSKRADGTSLSQVAPLKVEVVALDWKWLFILPEQGVASVNDLALPVGRPVEFTLTSSTVMNAFYIPSMAGMIYAMPAMETKLHGIFDQAGEYNGLASHYSGAGFSGMHFKVHAVDQAGFDAWVAAAKGAESTLDRAAYRALEAPSENVRPMYFASVEGGLFDRIVNLCVDDGKMCMADMMALDKRGGMGVTGTYNVAQLSYDKYGRRGLTPATGRAPLIVAALCTPEDSLAGLSLPSDRLKVPATDPLTGHGLALPKGPFAPRQMAAAGADLPASDL
ncbi:MAG: ubiquinol oxidase subunit II [Rhodobacteraceae bacterium]|nr:ubiquinol oxidase subunit II [Paracoccaceae bacterium]